MWSADSQAFERSDLSLVLAIVFKFRHWSHQSLDNLWETFNLTDNVVVPPPTIEASNPADHENSILGTDD
ncbi:uncharacterized protein N7529_006122 [Penicillium soppii]|uniref:uncharacterized protein n=1 Tax=Penicillium soppii TaxID=69789 RepID=UPI002546A0E5|nr:uncharacterized protein N7529_006122 [Penicillium soppii]KAJ5864206.1 hypothetical protein N7529_006122 [Penicillium soppii]